MIQDICLPCLMGEDSSGLRVRETITSRGEQSRVCLRKYRDINLSKVELKQRCTAVRLGTHVYACVYLTLAANVLNCKFSALALACLGPR